MLEGKVVNIEKPELLQFFYPDYKILDEVNMMNKRDKVIYTGRMRGNLDKFLKGRTKSYISTKGKMDYDFTKKINLAEFVYDYKGKRLTKKVKQTIEMMEWDEFINSIKLFWITGKWPYYLSDEDLSMFDLFKHSVGSTRKLIKTYFELLNKYPFYVVESSFMTFLMRTVAVEEQTVSNYYKRLLTQFDDKNKGKRGQAVLNYGKRGGKLYEKLNFLRLLLELK